MSAADRRLGQIPQSRLGYRLNLVHKPTFLCPVCLQDLPMEVYGPAVRWLCGHTRTLPPMPAGDNFVTRRKKAA